MRRVKSSSIFILLGCGINKLGKRKLSLKKVSQQDGCFLHTSFTPRRAETQAHNVLTGVAGRVHMYRLGC